MSNTDLKKTSVIVLCGGLGTRLRPVIGVQPKALATINGQPFLDILINYLRKQGLTKIILSIGYAGDRIKDYYQNKLALALKFSEETQPLGTGGALRKALFMTQSDYVLVVNGDTVCPIDYADLLKFHREKNALISMVVVPQQRSDGGGVKMTADNLIMEFQERPINKSYPFMNAGIYLLKKSVAAVLPNEEIFSLEQAFPKLIKAGSCFGYLTRTPVIDIGTPQRYSDAQTSIKNLNLI